MDFTSRADSVCYLLVSAFSSTLWNSPGERTYLTLFCEMRLWFVLLSHTKTMPNTQKTILLTSITHPITMISYTNPLDFIYNRNKNIKPNQTRTLTLFSISSLSLSVCVCLSPMQYKLIFVLFSVDSKILFQFSVYYFVWFVSLFVW